MIKHNFIVKLVKFMWLHSFACRANREHSSCYIMACWWAYCSSDNSKQDANYNCSNTESCCPSCIVQPSIMWSRIRPRHTSDYIQFWLAIEMCCSSTQTNLHACSVHVWQWVIYKIACGQTFKLWPSLFRWRVRNTGGGHGYQSPVHSECLICYYLKFKRRYLWFW